VLDGERRVVAYPAEQLDRRGGFQPIAKLNGDAASETAFAVFEMKARDTERVNVIIDDFRSTDGPQDQVGGGVVALRDSQAKEFAKRDIDVGVRIFVLERAVRVRKEAVAGEKADGSIQREVAHFDDMKSGDRERQFEYGLHRRMRVRIEVAVQRGVWKRARDGDAAFGVRGDSANFFPQDGLGGSGEGKKNECQCQPHDHSIASEINVAARERRMK